MAFDNSNSADLTALKNEYVNDPESIGYAAANGTTRAILALLNVAANNTTNATVNRPTDELLISEVAAVIDPTEYAALSEYEKEWVKMFINRENGADIKEYQAMFLAIFANGTTSRTDAIALRVKAASRAEQLFGVNTVITRNDLIKAKES